MSEQYVTFTLAHPLRTKDAEELGLEPRVYNVREQLTLLRREAERLAGAGFVLGADTNNRARWADALKPIKPAPAVATKPASGGKAE